MNLIHMSQVIQIMRVSQKRACSVKLRQTFLRIKRDNIRKPQQNLIEECRGVISFLLNRTFNFKSSFIISF